MPADFTIGRTISDDLPKKRLPKDRLLKTSLPISLDGCLSHGR
jgi:hypothetical protein